MKDAVVKKGINLVALAAILALSLSMFACAHKVVKETDATITQRLENQLYNYPTVSFDVTNNGLVDLKGRVYSAEEKARVVEIARNVEGVRGVKDEVLVYTPVQDGAPGAFMPDKTITGKIEALYRDEPALSNQPIGISTRQGVVTLTGAVEHQRLSVMAERYAGWVAGVKKVNNQLQVK